VTKLGAVSPQFGVPAGMFCDRRGLAGQDLRRSRGNVSYTGSAASALCWRRVLFAGHPLSALELIYLRLQTFQFQAF
jgi:hypothetical protein